MAPVTEIATFKLIAGAKIDDPSSPAGTLWKSALNTIASQEGFQRAYHGHQVENPSILQLFIDWNSIDAHKKFIEHPTYGPFAKTFMTFVDGEISMRHAHLNPHPASAALSSSSSPVTEVMTVFFAAHEPSYASQWAELVRVMEREAKGYKASAGGWVEEDVEDSCLGEGGKGKAFVGVIGWESVDAHMKFRETEAFKRNINLLREAGKVKGMEVHHTAFVER